MTKVQADVTKIQGSDDTRCGLIRPRESEGRSTNAGLDFGHRTGAVRGPGLIGGSVHNLSAHAGRPPSDRAPISLMIWATSRPSLEVINCTIAAPLCGRRSRHRAPRQLEPEPYPAAPAPISVGCLRWQSPPTLPKARIGQIEENTRQDQHRPPPQAQARRTPPPETAPGFGHGGRRSGPRLRL